MSIFEFDEKQFSVNSLLNLLKKQSIPANEAALLKELFPDIEVNPNDLNFFKAHFVLYHYLYKLSSYLTDNEHEFRLYFRLSSLYLLKVPTKGRCTFFIDDDIKFCNIKCDKEKNMCERHLSMDQQNVESGSLDFEGLRSYYLDWNNLNNTNQEDLDRMNRGAFYLIGSTNEIKESLNFMSLEANVSEQRIKNRYRYLATEMHPDTGGDEQRFAELNKAYKILLNWKRVE